MMIKKVRNDYIKKKVDEFFIEFKIKKLPIDPFKIINQKKWTLRTYKFYAHKHNVSIKDIIESYGSEDGFTIYKNGLYSIAYNDQIKPIGRIHFTLMHEIAHIYLKHLEEFKQTILTRGGLSDQEYEILEKEANIFASEVLSPYQVLIPLKFTNHKLIKKYCGLSSIAAKTRASQLFYLINNNVHIDENSVIYRNFYDFIHTKHCPICGFYFISKDAKYCPICGSKKLQWGEGYMKYKQGVKLDKNGRAEICPRCGNEEIGQNDLYCKICGTYIIQSCTNFVCNYKPDSNARYCPMCGSITTFYKEGLLKDWEEEKEELENAVDYENIDIDFSDFEELEAQ